MDSVGSVAMPGEGKGAQKRAQKKRTVDNPKGPSTVLRASYPESGDCLPLFSFLTPP